MSSIASQVRQDLRAALGGVSQQVLTNRVRKIKDAVPMSGEHALYVLAFENGLQLDKYLDKETLSEVAEQVLRYRQVTSPGTPDEKRRQDRMMPSATPSPRSVVVKVTGADFKDIPALMHPLVATAQRSAEGAYPLLFLFENSLRDLITRVLRAEYGDSWWTRVPTAVQSRATRFQANEAKEQWHTPRGDQPIQYVDLPDLATITTDDQLWRHFAGLFPRKEWLSGLVHDINVSRRIVAHMNVLPKDEVLGLQAAFRKWAKQLKANEHLIPW